MVMLVPRRNGYVGTKEKWLCWYQGEMVMLVPKEMAIRVNIFSHPAFWTGKIFVQQTQTPYNYIKHLSHLKTMEH